MDLLLIIMEIILIQMTRTEENGGKYDRYGEYFNGPNFNSELGMYKSDIKYSSFGDENELKQEI